MVSILLLFIIYIAFISLGLPDTIIGVSWPVMREYFNLPIDRIGYVSLVMTVSTVISSLMSGFLIDRLGTAKVVLVSIFLTAIALLGISIIPTFYWLLLLALPLGFGAGSIDTALNNYVALHYRAHHMNWLHGFWGVGASLGPFIVSFTLLSSGWRLGFSTISIIQFVIFGIVLLTIPLWKDTKRQGKKSKKRNAYLIKGVPLAVVIFMTYCAIEFSIGLWGSSYLVDDKLLPADSAAQVIAIYYLGITLGRFLSGALSFKFSNRNLIYSGIIVMMIGVSLMNINLNYSIIYLPYLIVGVGLAPIFPSLVHETPKLFGEENSQYVIGYQLAGAYLGGSVFPPIFGVAASLIGIWIFPIYIFGLGVIVLLLIYILLTNYKDRYTVVEDR